MSRGERYAFTYVYHLGIALYLLKIIWDVFCDGGVAIFIANLSSWIIYVEQYFIVEFLQRKKNCKMFEIKYILYIFLIMWDLRGKKKKKKPLERNYC